VDLSFSNPQHGPLHALSGAGSEGSLLVAKRDALDMVNGSGDANDLDGEVDMPIMLCLGT
jgi:hypothetical protein